MHARAYSPIGHLELIYAMRLKTNGFELLQRRRRGRGGFALQPPGLACTMDTPLAPLGNVICMQSKSIVISHMAIDFLRRWVILEQLVRAPGGELYAKPRANDEIRYSLESGYCLYKTAFLASVIEMLIRGQVLSTQETCSLEVSSGFYLKVKSISQKYFPSRFD